GRRAGSSPLPREVRGAGGAACLDHVRRLPAETRGGLLTILAGLGVDPHRLLASRRPSPGEARKLWLAHGLARQVWAVVLDEPTNHLDLPSIERLVGTLVVYSGSRLLVTHRHATGRLTTAPRWAIERSVTSTRWAIEAGRIEVVSELAAEA